MAINFKSFKTYTFLILSMLFWGLSFVWFKIVVVYYAPITIIFIRLLISASFMLLFLLLTGTFQRIQRKHLKHFLLLSFTQPFCYFLGESFGLTTVTSTVASVIIATIPLFSPFAGYYLARERISKMVVLGLFFSFAGILLMLINKNLSFNADPKGVLLLFFAVFSAVAYSVIVRKITNEYSPVTIITFQNLFGALYFLPLFLIFDFKQFIQVVPTRELVVAMLQLSLFASTLSYVFYIIAIKEIGITKSNIFTNLIPVFTGIFSFFVLHEVFTSFKIAGMLLVMFGLVVSQAKKITGLLKSGNKAIKG